MAKGLGYIYATTSKGFRELIMIPSALLYEKTIEVIDARKGAEQHAAIRHAWGDGDLLSRLLIDVDSVEGRNKDS